MTAVPAPIRRCTLAALGVLLAAAAFAEEPFEEGVPPRSRWRVPSAERWGGEVSGGFGNDVVFEEPSSGGPWGEISIEGYWDELPEADWDLGRILVCPDEDPAPLEERLAEFGLELVVLTPDIAFVELPYEMQPGALLHLMKLIASLEGACDVEPDYWLHRPEGSQSNVIVVGSTFGRSFKRQGVLRRIRAHRAQRTATGDGTVVAVLDTGVDRDHPAVAESLLPGRDFVDFDDDPSEQRDGVDGDLDGRIDEGFGHGTFVSGLVLAVAPDTRILPVRVLDDEGRGDAATIAAAISYAVERGADVINLSLGMRRRSAAVESQVRRALDAGVTIVAASGQAGRRSRVDFPANVEGVVSVTSVGNGRRRDRRANALVAVPGRKVIGPYPGATWGKAAGTSFATALTSGAVALLRSHAPELTVEEVLAKLAERSQLRTDRLVK